MLLKREKHAISSYCDFHKEYNERQMFSHIEPNVTCNKQDS